MSQLKSNLFSGQSLNLKDTGKQALNDLGQQTLGQAKEQAVAQVFGGISSQLNTHLSPEQMMMGQVGFNPNPTGNKK